MFDFSEKVVLITGAAGNLGQATALAFHKAGAKLALADNRPDRLDALYGDIAGASCFLTSVDITSEAAVAAMVADVHGAYGRIDVLCNIAGGFRMGPPVQETPVDTWDFLMSLNAKSVFLVSRAVIPHMLAAGSGRIVNIAARAALSGQARMAPYVASKSAVMRLTESMAAELKTDGINVNCILPGTIDTPQNREAMPKANHSQWVAPAALADVILFLASTEARAVTGAAVPVYGRG